LDQVFELIGLSVVTEVVFLRVPDATDNDSTFSAGVADDLAQRLFESAADNVATDLLVAFELQSLDGFAAAHQRYAAAGDNAFLDRSAGGMHCVLNAGFLFLHFGSGGRADFNDGNAAHQLRQPLLQLLLVVVAGGLFDLAADFVHTTFDIG